MNQSNAVRGDVTEAKRGLYKNHLMLVWPVIHDISPDNKSTVKSHVRMVNYNLFMAITKTRNGESGKGIGEWGMGNEEW